MTTELQRALDESNCLTVKELRQQLRDYPDDMPVVFKYNYGDHWRTQVAAPASDLEEGEVEWSDYHSMPKIVDDEDEHDEAQPERVAVLVIGG